jgi:nitroimidazol reductase NimA-like FMN-containing flavoprotein (pyridoxamine 5'-phosphate oxidase superfamily)
VTAVLSAEVAAYVDAARVARLATVRPDGALHVVPICPVLDGDRVLFMSEPAIKIDNLRADPRVGLAFDEYHEDWDRLRGVSVNGAATVHGSGPTWERGRDLLYEKFPQFLPDVPIVEGRTLIVEVEIDWVSRGGV